MGREEQKEEREVLDSIFPDEITGTQRRREATITVLTPPLQIFPRRNTAYP